MILFTISIWKGLIVLFGASILLSLCLTIFLSVKEKEFEGFFEVWVSLTILCFICTGISFLAIKCILFGFGGVI